MAFLVFNIISTFFGQALNGKTRDVGRWHQNWIQCQPAYLAYFHIIQALLGHVTCQRSAWMTRRDAKYAFIVLCIAGLLF